jgi:hypothetical protein
MKTLLLFVLTAVLLQAEPLPATVTAETKLEMGKGKSSVLLKPGSKVNVVGKEGDFLIVIYRNIQGFVPQAKTDFKGDVPKATTPAPSQTTDGQGSETPKAPIAKPTETKPTGTKPVEATSAPAKPVPPSAPAKREPTTNYGKMVKMAQDNVAKHEETMVDPTNAQTGATKKK